MKTDFSKRSPAEWAEVYGPPAVNFVSRVIRTSVAIALCLILSTVVAAQNPPTAPQKSVDAQKCAALVELNVEDAPGGPARITSARLVEVPATSLELWILTPSGFASGTAKDTVQIREYCDVTGYVAPQNKFELKLPLPNDWNEKFFFYACGAFCGTVFGDACNLGLERGYASVTGNGGHDSAWGFDGVWAANTPELLSIEVKATTVGVAASMHVTRNEWDYATTARTR